MQNQSEKEGHLNVFSNVKCRRHPEEYINFLCISSEMCPKDNLLCTSCIDSSGRDHSHQLISLRRFHSFLQAYSNQAQVYTAKAKEVSLYLIQAIQTLRKEIGQQIDGLENLSVCQLSLGVDGDISTELELRVKLQDLAARGIWSRLHEKVHKEEEIGPEIEEEIEQYWQPTSNIMKELLNTAKLSCQKLQTEYALLKEEESSEASKNGTRLRKRDPIKTIPIDEIESDDESSQEEIEEENGYYKGKKSKVKKMRKGKIKRYSRSEKLNILNQVKEYSIQMNSSQCKRMIARRYKIATSTLLRWEKWYNKEYPNKQNQQIEQIKIQDSN